jgi:pentatricopeptide repeat protein
MQRRALIDMYTKCRGSAEIAHRLFDKMPERNVIYWSAMIAGYVQIGKANESLALFNQMQPADMKPDAVTIVNVLPACAHLSALQPGKCLHGYIIRSGYESDMFVGNSLIDMYKPVDRFGLLAGLNRSTGSVYWLV